jgi:hypothetical protein
MAPISALSSDRQELGRLRRCLVGTHCSGHAHDFLSATGATLGNV